VQKAIGAYQNFSESSGTVSAAFGNTGDDDRESGTIEACKKLLAAGVQVMLYYGDA
jgi:UDP-glucose 6-dehydrogenase